MKIKTILIAGTLLGGNSLTQGDERTFGDGTLPEFLRQFDILKDGRIDEEERQAIKEARKAAREESRAEIDSDGDGEITSEEGEAARDAIREKIAEKRAEKFAEIVGEDGLLSYEEFILLPPLSGASEERLLSIFARLDQDDNEGVSLEEFNARLRKYGKDKDKDKDKDKTDDEDTDDGNTDDQERPVAPPERPIGGRR